MRDVFVAADNIFSPLGTTTAENYSQLKKGISGVARHDRPEMSDQPFYAALFDPGFTSPVSPLTRHASPLTKFEQLLQSSIADALATGGFDPTDPRTILILSTTKGNISLLETGTATGSTAAGNTATGSTVTGNTATGSTSTGGTVAGMDLGQLNKRIALPTSARLIADYFHFAHSPIIVSNACISGLLALITAMRLIRSGRYDNAVVAGADVISRFVLSGFNSFQAISPGLCRPFDRSRDGINLGEGAGTVILSARQQYRDRIRLAGGSVSNDANHISGPSRSGQELAQVIDRSLKDAGCDRKAIGFISAHGTATIYNDEMEAKAITLAGLQSVPVNSLKGYYGHTLGAAGLIESIVTLQSMREDLVLPSLGFEEDGVTTPLNISTSLLHTPLNTCLKTASGFGGCNAAVVMSK